MVDERALDPVIALADDHPIVRAALRAALAALGPGTRFVEAIDAATTLALVADEPSLDLLLMDLHMPGAEGTATVRAVRARAPQLPVAVVSADEDPAAVAELLRMGVCGFIPKSDSANVIVSAVRLILAGGTYVPPRLVHGDARGAAEGGNGAGGDRLGLTARQYDVLRLLGEGKSNKVIARELGITEGTVKVHLLAVFRALNVRNRTAAVVAAQRYQR
ncbi:MAG: response regulator transcription factor [Betaproteobacteria bacterium]|nr:response regulator transcription factor [Betaproteobacteria bacterium]MCC7215457.1 response regulator transcription factor [Burkholderiales bacterium]